MTTSTSSPTATTATETATETAKATTTTTPKSASATANSNQQHDFKVGDIVLAKMPSYPPWPAMIVPDSVLPENVLSAKPVPNNSNNPKWPVWFFNDGNYQWTPRPHLKVLTKEIMEKYLSSTNSKKRRSALYHAYELALEQPTLDEIFGDADDDEDEDDEEEEDDAEDEEAEEAEDDADDHEQEVKAEVKAETKKTNNGTSKTNNKKRKSTEPVVNDKKRKTSVVKKESIPSITSTTNGNLSDSKSTTGNGTSNGSNSNVRREYTDEQKIMIVKSYRVKLQRGLLNKELELTDEIIRQCSDIFTQMERFNLIYGMNLNLLKISKLHKVMKAILKLPNLEFPNDFKFHERSLKLLDSWEGLITIIKSEKNEK
ncbi:unnamed protein product [[Candida] boidinii]|uniref:Unnamed protein product n=1 Tax=Candida boidinii TaxID=5477 RepID=A0A9W6SYZ5_CANBO|nr:hypothetical protein B5S30_g3323 [[Candida] boidinii]GME68946.1 unnamed protein product [[Candida] boidinii]GMG00083.1 unnamed protein product [[Candida] boidinii]